MTCPASTPSHDYSPGSPFLWTDCPDYSHALAPRPGTKTRVRTLVELTQDHGYRDGLVIPCHAMDDRGRTHAAVISLFWSGDPKDLILTPRAGLVGPLPLWFRMVMLLYHEQCVRLRQDDAPKPADPVRLTDRERECLVWAARGKTIGDTSAILGLSERTIEFHVRNAMRKLGVYNKIHAVAVAVHLGLISP